VTTVRPLADDCNAEPGLLGAGDSDSVGDG
jgi:hypothetical protein